MQKKEILTREVEVKWCGKNVREQKCKSDLSSFFYADLRSVLYLL